MENLFANDMFIKEGAKKINWARRNMPILASLEEDFIKNQYFKGITILVCVHIEAKTARLAILLRDSGAVVAVCGCNPLSTQDDVAAALNQEENISVFAHYGASEKEYYDYIDSALDLNPQIIVDDGGDVVYHIHTKRKELIETIYGGSEETTTGVIRLRSMEKEGVLAFPVTAVNDTYCKYLFDNRYGTGQSVWNGINRTTNLIVAGKDVVIAGYGWCGKGTAMRAKGLGANVIITEIDPVKAIEAIMDGFKVMPMGEAAKVGDIFVTLTGCKDVIVKEHFLEMKDGVILANAGHFDVEINIPMLESISIGKKEVRANIESYSLANGKTINLLAKGRLVNLAAGDGHPAEIMDMSFALQALSVKHMLENYKSLENKVYPVSSEIDQKVALLKLTSMNVSIDSLTNEQKKYLKSWDA